MRQKNAPGYWVGKTHWKDADRQVWKRSTPIESRRLERKTVRRRWQSTELNADSQPRSLSSTSPTVRLPGPKPETYAPLRLSRDDLYCPSICQPSQLKDGPNRGSRRVTRQLALFFIQY